jgi:alanyl-tRNA synthetase
VAPDRLRFDFTHFAPLSEAEIEMIEDKVNGQIWRNQTVETRLMDLDTAMKSGAMALFGEKYQETVRVVEVEGFSKELCGGTHVHATGSIGSFKIIAESGISAGVRRIEAITGAGALGRFRQAEKLLDNLQFQYKIARAELPGYLEKLNTQVRDLQRQINDLKSRNARSSIGEILSSARTVAGARVIACQVPEMDRPAMRSLADELRQKLGSGVVIIGSPAEEKVAIVVMVSEDLCGKIPAGKIIKQIAPLVGGSGGGKAELAEAGGKDSSKLADALERSYNIISSMLGA